MINYATIEVSEETRSDIVDDILRLYANGYDADTIANKHAEHSAFVYSVIYVVEGLEDLALDAEASCLPASRTREQPDWGKILPPQQVLQGG